MHVDWSVYWRSEPRARQIRGSDIGAADPTVSGSLILASVLPMHLRGAITPDQALIATECLTTLDPAVLDGETGSVTSVAWLLDPTRVQAVRASFIFAHGTVSTGASWLDQPHSRDCVGSGLRHPEPCPAFPSEH